MIIKTFRKFIQIDQRFDSIEMRSVFGNLDKIFLEPIKTLKNDATSTVVLAKINHQLFVIKRANTKSRMHSLRRAFKISRAQKNWRNARHLNQIGISAIQAAAMIEERWGIFRRRSYFICPFIDGIDARHFFAEDMQPNDNWPIAVENICLMLKKLADNKLSHRDLNLSNIILVNNTPYLLDLDAMTHNKNTWIAKRAAKKELQRFMQNWENIPKPHRQAASLFQKKLIEFK